MPTIRPAIRHPHPTAPLVALVALLTTVSAATPLAAATLPAELLAATAGGGRAEALVVLRDQADLSSAAELRGREARGRWVVERLRAVATGSQGPLLDFLRAEGIDHRPYWIVNMIWVRGDRRALGRIAARPEVDRLAPNPRVRVALPVPQPAASARTPAAPEPNLEFHGAPEVFWSAGFTGQGTVVAAGDTGQDWEHPALRAAYRGWDGETASHDYNWWDAIHTGGGRCGADSPEPCDDSDHGTPTMGVAVGDDGAGNQIGMAPGARWIACRNMDQGVGTPATYAECFQFFLAPTDLAGGNPRPELAPDVVNNSWICPESEGCTDPDVLRDVVESLTAAGIVVVASAGNDGPSCGSVYAPPAIYDAAWTVGSTNVFGEVSGFSARGPVTSDGSGRIKPDFLAAGEAIRSAVPGGGYAGFDGTSMAGPHVVGLAALMISARPCLAGELGAMEAHLRENTLFLETSESCGDVPGDAIPNNTYGWGIAMSALPGPELCEAPRVGGRVTGVDAELALCRNLDTGDAVTLELGDGDAGRWDCVAAGLAVGAGDTLLLGARGGADGADAVGGAVAGVDATAALCRNETTGETVTPPLADGASWDCEAAGLVVAPGDRILQGARGTAGAGR